MGKEYLAREFTRLRLEHVPSAANFILLRVGNGEEVFKQLLRLGVIVRPMGAYDLPAYVRVTVGTAQENQKLIESLDRIIKSS